MNITVISLQDKADCVIWTTYYTLNIPVLAKISIMWLDIISLIFDLTNENDTHAQQFVMLALVRLRAKSVCASFISNP